MDTSGRYIIKYQEENYMNQYVFEEERPVVDTKCGKIRGIAYGGVNIFMGIDYAKAKRFQMPV